MQFIRATSTAALFLLFGTTVPAYAQQDQQNEKEGKPEKHQGRQEQGARPPAQQQRPQGQPQRPQARGQQQQKQPQEVRQQQQPNRTRQEAVAWQQQQGWLQQGGWRGESTWQRGRAQRWESQHRTWTQRGGYGGYYIPQARFSLYFGSQHWFRMHSRPTIYMGYPRFSYSGFSFLLVDPWPEYWAENWYDTDDVYIDYDDGYYLYNRRYPSVRLAITVAL
jgi:hypothetical protein